MKKELVRLISIFLFVMMLSISTYAENQPKAASGWQIRMMPYFWLPEIKSDSTINGITGTIDLSLDDVIDALDFTAMGRAEAWNGRWGLTFDGVFMNLAASGGFQGRRNFAGLNLDIDARVGMADFGVAYRLFEHPFGSNNKQKLIFEPYGGLRYGYIRQKVDLNVDIAGIGTAGATLGGSQDWVEPFVGGRLVWELNDKIAFNVRGDAGGFGIGSASELIWNFAAGVNYKLSENISIDAGYRILDIDYSRGSGSSEFGMDAETKGPVFGMTILF